MVGCHLKLLYEQLGTGVGREFTACSLELATICGFRQSVSENSHRATVETLTHDFGADPLILASPG